MPPCSSCRSGHWALPPPNTVLGGGSAQCPLLHEEQGGITIDQAGVVETKRTGTACLKLCAGLGVSACEERDVMALPDKFFGQVGHDPFGPAVQLRGHTFPERRQLSDLHVGDPFYKRTCAR